MIPVLFSLWWNSVCISWLVGAGTGNTVSHCVRLKWKPWPGLAGLGNCCKAHTVCVSLELGYLCEMGFEGSAALLGAHPCTNSQAKRSPGFNSTLSQAAAWAGEAHKLLAQSFLSAQVLFPRGRLLSFKLRGQKRSSLRKTNFPVSRHQKNLLQTKNATIFLCFLLTLRYKTIKVIYIQLLHIYYTV